MNIFIIYRRYSITMTFYEEKNEFANSYLDLMEQNYKKIQQYPCDIKPS